MIPHKIRGVGWLKWKSSKILAHLVKFEREFSKIRWQAFGHTDYDVGHPILIKYVYMPWNCVSVRTRKQDIPDGRDVLSDSTTLKLRIMLSFFSIFRLFSHKSVAKINTLALTSAPNWKKISKWQAINVTVGIIGSNNIHSINLIAVYLVKTVWGREL